MLVMPNLTSKADFSFTLLKSSGRISGKASAEFALFSQPVNGKRSPPEIRFASGGLLYACPCADIHFSILAPRLFSALVLGFVSVLGLPSRKSKSFKSSAGCRPFLLRVRSRWSRISATDCSTKVKFCVDILLYPCVILVVKLLLVKTFTDSSSGITSVAGCIFNPVFHPLGYPTWFVSQVCISFSEFPYLPVPCTVHSDPESLISAGSMFIVRYHCRVELLFVARCPLRCRYFSSVRSIRLMVGRLRACNSSSELGFGKSIRRSLYSEYTVVFGY